VLSVVSVGVHAPLAFQGTPDDARNLLIGIAGTMVTVIALMLGLTVVARSCRPPSSRPGCCATSCGTGRPRSS
jgi:uncharacterized membrane protein